MEFPWRRVAKGLAVFATLAPVVLYLSSAWMFNGLTPDPVVLREQLAPAALLWQPNPATTDAAKERPVGSFEATAPREGDADPLVVSVEIKAVEASPAAAKPTEYGDVFAADMAARSRWLLASMGLTLAAVGCGLFGAAALGRNGWPWVVSPVLLALGVVMGICVVGPWRDSVDPLRAIVADCNEFNPESQPDGGCLLNRIAHGSDDDLTYTYGAFDTDTLTAVRWIVGWNAAIGTGAAGFLAGAFGALAWPAAEQSSAEQTPADLRRRRRCYFLVLGAGAALLSFAVAATHAFYNWASALVWPPASTQLAALASTNSGQWGFVYTMILVAAAGATALALHSAINAAADQAAKNKQEAENAAATGDAAQKAAAAAMPSFDDWLKQERLAFDPLKALAALLMTAAPLATSPLLDALKAAIG